MPRVSVNIPCFNSEKYIAETIQSVLDQTFEDFEVIVVNDGSSDKTGEIVKSFSDPRIKYYAQENIGLSRTRNRQLELSSGEFIAFLDHDDIWMPQKLEKQIPLFEKNPNVGLVYCDTVFFQGKKDLYSVYSKEKPHRGRVFRELLSRYFLSMETVVIKRQALVGLDHWFDDALTMAEEMDLFLRIAYQWELDYVDEPLAKWRMHNESESHKHSYLIAREKEIILEKLSRLFPDFENQYAQEIKEQKKMIDYHWALSMWEKGDKAKAREYLRPYVFKEKKMLIAFLLSVFPYSFYRSLKNTYYSLKPCK